MMVPMGQDELAYVGLGANVGAAVESLTHAVATLAAPSETVLEGVSRLYRTRPVGPVAQADFLNAVVALRVPAGPSPRDGAMALLIALKSIERALGRVEREHWGPREVDLDLLLFGDHRVSVERDVAARSADQARLGSQWLEVPHPAAVDRLFVLAPLADLAADLRPPGWEVSVEAARRQALAAEGPEAVVVAADWDPSTQRWSGIGS
jgi:2-amino-4-hydroxy-6-hydroxymethyldihydropteridine diphosphokinase